jgi:hypothetical protein
LFLFIFLICSSDSETDESSDDVTIPLGTGMATTAPAAAVPPYMQMDNTSQNKAAFNMALLGDMPATAPATAPAAAVPAIVPATAPATAPAAAVPFWMQDIQQEVRYVMLCYVALFCVV